MKDKNIVVMNFSGVYEPQGFYKNLEGTAVTWLDCQEIPGTNCYCDESAEEAIREKIRELPMEGIHFLDSGNYHYLTKLWMEKAEEPFDLLVFDHHTDMQLPAFGDILSCGGWIKNALDTNHFLKRVYLAGPPESAWEEAKKDLTEEERARVFWIGEEELEPEALARFFKENGQEITCPLYISLDKDVLCQGDARTNWDQGTVPLKLILSCLKAVQKERRMMGIDVCGENPEGMEGAQSLTEQEINGRTNQEICEIMLKYTKIL